MTDVDDIAMLEHDLERSILRDSFAAFAERFWSTMTGREFLPNRATTEVIQALQGVADGKILRLLIALPPGVGKSTLLALYAAWRMARDPGHRAIHAGHAYELAATESRRVRRLVESDAFRVMFGEVRIRDDESTIALWSTDANGMYLACGTDTGLTGRRAHEAVVDDPLAAVDRFSRAARDAVYVWLTESLLSRLDGDRAPCVIVSQRLDTDDLIGRLIAAGGWTLLELPAEDDEGNLLAPEILSREKLDELKTQLGSAVYACQYLQRPASDEQATIKRTWWRHYAPNELPDRFDRVVVACDLTFGSAKGDYAVAHVGGSKGGQRFLLEEWRARGAGLEVTLAALQGIASRYPGCKIVVEKAALGSAVIETLRKSLTGVVPVQPIGKKAQRLAAVAPQVESGSWHLPSSAAWVGDFIEELAGASKFDDRQDAFSYLAADLAHRGGADFDFVVGPGMYQVSEAVEMRMRGADDPFALDAYALAPWRSYNR